MYASVYLEVKISTTQERFYKTSKELKTYGTILRLKLLETEGQKSESYRHV